MYQNVLVYKEYSLLKCILAFITLTLVFNSSVSAENESSYTYRIENGNAIISSVNSTESGEIYLPAMLDGLSVSGIDDWAFSDNKLINSVIIPDTVKKIGDGAFSGCKNLLSVSIPDSVTFIGVDAFWNCTSLRNITIPDSVKTIGMFAFSECTSLERVVLGDNVTSIGNFAFDKCFSLKTVYLSKKLEKIGVSAFNECRSLIDIWYPLGKTDRAKISVLSGNSLSHCLWHYDNSEIGSLAGDINGDKKVNNRDITGLFRHLSKWDIKVNTDALDINGDGNVNNKDLVRLFQYLSNWEIEIC